MLSVPRAYLEYIVYKDYHVFMTVVFKNLLHSLSTPRARRRKILLAMKYSPCQIFTPPYFFCLWRHVCELDYPCVHQTPYVHVCSVSISLQLARVSFALSSSVTAFHVSFRSRLRPRSPKDVSHNSSQYYTRSVCLAFVLLLDICLEI